LSGRKGTGAIAVPLKKGIRLLNYSRNLMGKDFGGKAITQASVTRYTIEEMQNAKLKMENGRQKTRVFHFAFYIFNFAF